ncbi:hypothetical protein MPSEU_000919100 [Mayamaea pseudoterrestris]|nr:hypothetical protein MPSEU_000919100 [Mayamaea pseudoterrestris]
MAEDINIRGEAVLDRKNETYIDQTAQEIDGDATTIHLLGMPASGDSNDEHDQFLAMKIASKERQREANEKACKGRLQATQSYNDENDENGAYDANDTDDNDVETFNDHIHDIYRYDHVNDIWFKD